MNDLLYSFHIVLPIFIVLAIGYLAKICHILDDHGVTIVNKIVFNLALPALLFRDIRANNFSLAFDFRLICFAILGISIGFFIIWIFSSIFLKDEKQIASFVQAAFRSNYVVIGLPIYLFVAGDSDSSKAMLLTAFVVPVFNMWAVVILTYYSSQEIKAWHLLTSVLKNPLLLASFLGAMFSIFKLSIPAFLDVALSYISELSTPLALLSIGAFLNVKELKQSFSLSFVASLIKLVLFPLVICLIAYLFGLHKRDIFILYILFGSPSPVSSFIMAQATKNDEQLSAASVVLSTLLCVITFTAGIYVFKSLHWV